MRSTVLVERCSPAGLTIMEPFPPAMPDVHTSIDGGYNSINYKVVADQSSQGEVVKFRSRYSMTGRKRSLVVLDALTVLEFVPRGSLNPRSDFDTTVEGVSEFLGLGVPFNVNTPRGPVKGISFGGIDMAMRKLVDEEKATELLQEAGLALSPKYYRTLITHFFASLL